MKYEQIRQFTSEVQDEILDALEHLIDTMGDGETQNTNTQWRVQSKDKAALVTLSVTISDDELTMALFTSFDGVSSEVTSCTLSLNDEGVMRITDGVYEGEDFDYETLNSEYKIVEYIDEVCNLCKEINGKVDNHKNIA